MTWLDWLLAWFAARVLRLMRKRIKSGTPRVWYVRGMTNQPQRLPSGALTAKWGGLRIGFGRADNLFDIYLTRDQFDKLHEGIGDVIVGQDAQYARLEDQ